MITEAEVRERFEDAILLALKMEEAARSQGLQAAAGNWKRQGSPFSPRASRRNQPCRHLDFRTSALRDCKRIPGVRAWVDQTFSGLEH